MIVQVKEASRLGTKFNCWKWRLWEDPDEFSNGEVVAESTHFYSTEEAAHKAGTEAMEKANDPQRQWHEFQVESDGVVIYSDWDGIDPEWTEGRAPERTDAILGFDGIPLYWNGEHDAARKVEILWVEVGEGIIVKEERLDVTHAVLFKTAMEAREGATKMIEEAIRDYRLWKDEV